MLNKLKLILRQWLFKEEINELQILHNQVYNINKNINDAINSYNSAINLHNSARIKCSTAFELAEETRKLIDSIIDVGTDIGFKGKDHSWAVVCIKGKPEYVKFVPLFNRHRDARDIIHFLKQFEYSNRITDSPFGFNEMIEDHILKY